MKINLNNTVASGLNSNTNKYNLEGKYIYGARIKGKNITKKII